MLDARESWESLITHVAIIGAGIVGVSTALWLQRAGVQVTVIDRAGWAAGTSHGNAGVLAACSMVPITGPGLTRKAPRMVMDPDQPLFMRWSYLPKLLPWLRKYLAHANDADTRRISAGVAPLVSDAVDQHMSLAEGTPAQTHLSTSGYSFGYGSHSEMQGDDYALAIRASHGFTPEIIEGEDLRRAEPNLSDTINVLARMPNCGSVTDPGAYVAALGDAFLAAGGQLKTATVTDIALTQDRITAVQTDAGDIPCDIAVIATGVWSKPLMHKLGISVPLESERGYHIVFKNARNGPNHPIMINAGKFVATPMDQGVRCAGIVEFGGLDAGPSKAPFDLLRRKTKEAFPNMTWDDEIEWQGHRPAPADSLPLIGEIRKTGVFAGFGHHHIGLTAGPKTGRILAGLITGTAPNLDLTPYAPTRFA
ncbi:MAG: FAD-dependent oxidoreductase [Pseudomonadota bacterium]